MRGDFSRIAFNRGKGYTAVLEQQGRVALDADANEQCFIDQYLRGSETVDTIGQYGGPAGDAGFEITVSGGEIQIGPGRYYAGGLLCENPATLSYDAQPYLLGASPTGAQILSELIAAPAGAAVQVHLEAWQRLVTELDDPCLREPALGQADTTARLQSVWRVVAALQTQVGTPTQAQPPGMAPCCQLMYESLPTASTGTMSAAVAGSTAACGCQPIPAAGYQGVENQLYRVEIHQGGDETTATFKWSRENGSVVSAVTAISGATVTVNSLGPDANLGYQNLQWVELSDDTNLFGEDPNQPGSLYQIQSIQPTDPSLTLGGTVTPVNPAQNARLRRWDQSGPAAGADGIPLSAGTWITLENGIQVQFSQGQYQPGDYWTIPARTATGTIEWPPCDGANGNGAQLPTSVQVYRAPLACIHWVRELIREGTQAGPATAPGAQAAPASGAQAAPASGAQAAPASGAQAAIGVAKAPATLAGGIVRVAAAAPTSTAAETELEAAARGPASVTAAAEPSVAATSRAAAAFQLGHFTWDDCRLSFSPLTALTPATTPAALHVESVSWANDDITTLDQLVANGLAVELDQAPTSPVNGANFVVTVETVSANPKEAQEPVVAATMDVSLLPSTLLRTVTVVDAQITLAGQTLTWEVPYDTGSIFQKLTVIALDAMILPGAQAGLFARARVKLLGEMIFASGASGPVYLDGDAFGQSALRADGTTPRINLQLPSGKGSVASDLDGWFYLAPTLSVQSLTVEYPALTVLVSPTNVVTGVQYTPPGGAAETVTATASIVLNYPPVAAGTVALALTGASGVGTVVSVPASVPIVTGQTSISVPITVLSSPGANTTLTFELTATLAAATGPSSSQTVSFTVAGMTPPQAAAQ